MWTLADNLSPSAATLTSDIRPPTSLAKTTLTIPPDFHSLLVFCQTKLTDPFRGKPNPIEGGTIPTDIARRNPLRFSRSIKIEMFGRYPIGIDKLRSEKMMRFLSSGSI